LELGAWDLGFPDEVGRRKLVEPMKSRLIRHWLMFLVAVCALAGLTNCAFISRHVFSEPSVDWQSRNGQLLYRNQRTTLIGEVLVRFSKSGEFEMTFSKGPGVNLLTLRQDANFAQIKGGLARGVWSGPVAGAPLRLRGWLELRDALAKGADKKEIRHTSGRETFVFHF
jgi:hypothetical protein